MRTEVQSLKSQAFHWKLQTEAPRGMHQPSNRAGFTLIELLVVISVIAILASLVFPVTRIVNRNKLRTRTFAELRQVETAIDGYKAKLGHYPPDNPGRHQPFQMCNHALNQLFYELMGTTNKNGTYVSRDDVAQLSQTDLETIFGKSVQGMVNCSRGGGDDEGTTAMKFLASLKPGQVGTITNRPGNPLLTVLGVTAPGPLLYQSPTPPFGMINPLRYNSSSPTNNPTTYDLWVDVIIDGKTNRFSNWSSDPQIVGSPL